MMIVVNRIDKSITGAVNGKSYGVKYTEDKYLEMKRLEKEANEAVSIEALKAIVEQFMPFTEDAYKEMVETACPNVMMNEATGKFYLITDDGVIISSKPMPQALVDRILTSVEAKIDPTPIVKFWTRLLRNPNFTQAKAEIIARYINQTIIDHELKNELIDKKGVSPEVAIQRATVYQTPITMEGLLVTYKVSAELLDKFDPETGKKVDRYPGGYDEDTGEKKKAQLPDHVEDRVFYPWCQGLTGGDPFYCYELQTDKKGHALDVQDKGPLKHLIKVGRVIELDNWSQVDCYDHHSCVKGMHAGNRDYIAGYMGQTGAITHNIFIDPMDIGACTNDGSGAIRVRRYYVHSSNAGINRSIYHSSKYASMTDKDWDAYRKAAIEQSEKLEAEKAELKKQVAAI